MLIAVFCDRGSPGATTTALALGLASPEPTVVVEADPYGGDLALRCTDPRGKAFPETPTVLTVATAARTSLAPDLVISYAHEFTGSTRLVPGHLSAEQSAGITDWAPLARALKASVSRMVVDLGRIHSGSPTLPIAAAADVLVVVTRADMGAVVHLRDRLERLVPTLVAERGTPPVIVPVVVTHRRIAGPVVGQLRSLLAASSVEPVVVDVGWLAWDPEGVSRLEAGHVSGRDARTPLLGSAASVCDQIMTAAGPGFDSWQVTTKGSEVPAR